MTARRANSDLTAGSSSRTLIAMVAEQVKESAKRLGAGVKSYAAQRAPQWVQFYEGSFAPWLETELGAASSALVMWLLRAPFRGRLRLKKATIQPAQADSATEGAGA